MLDIDPDAILPEKNEEVEIDGYLYRVISHECFLNMTAPPRRGRRVGLIVKSI